MGAQLRSEGFDGAAIVMLGGADFGSTSGYWSRFVMADDLGHWVGELVHQTGLCNLPDLFDFTNEYPAENMLGFDQEAGYLATHFWAGPNGPSNGLMLPRFPSTRVNERATHCMPSV